MPEGGFFERRSISPTGLIIVIALHAAAITALALSKMEMPGQAEFKRLIVDHIENPREPEPIPPEPVDNKQKVEVPPKTQIDVVPPRVPTVPRGPVVAHDPRILPPVFDTRPPPKVDLPQADPLPPQPKVEPKPPVRVEAKMRSGDLQPPYPPSEEQAEREGTVTIRITIGPDGRVKAAAKMSATSDAFYRATEKHALRAWKFSPASVDGKPVESSKVLTVHFRLNE